MGNLLGSPVTEKETHIGVTAEGLEYGVSSMQGWRVHMEDAHITEPKLYAECPPVGNNSDPDAGFQKIQLPGHALFAVFDGHGGTFAAEYAGRNLCRVLSRQPKFVRYAKFVQERPQKVKQMNNSAEQVQYVRSGLELLEGALRDAFVDVDEEILRTMRGEPVPGANAPYNNTDPPPVSRSNADADRMDDSSNPAEDDAGNPEPNEDEDSGTTAVVVVVTPDWIVCANSGDSRAVFSKQGHKAVPLSYDHKPDDEEEERRIRAAGGYVAGGRVEGDLAVSRGFGDYRFKLMPTVLAGAAEWDNGDDDESSKKKAKNNSVVRPEDQKVSPVPDIIVQNRSGDHDEFIVIACDGIWDVQTNYECVKTVADIFEEGENALGLVCEELLDLCLSMGSKDNMTALILKFPAQKIGTGGGVTARRQKREATTEASETAGVIAADVMSGNEAEMKEDGEIKIEEDST